MSNIITQPAKIIKPLDFIKYRITGMNGKQIIKTLETNGWVHTRSNGSHHMMKKGGVSVPVPVHGAHDLKIGLVKKIEKQTGVKLT